MITILFIIIGYMLGSILFSELSMLLFHRKSLFEASANHNPGVSNAYKYGGFWCGTLAVTGDLLKGILPVALYIKSCGYETAGLALVMIAPVLGHAFSCFWKFKGGMSITASFGVFIGLFPHWIPMCILIVLFLIMLVIPGLDNSLGSIYVFSGLSLIGLVLAFLHFLPWIVWAGIFAISLIVCLKMWSDLTMDDKARLKHIILRK